MGGVYDFVAVVTSDDPVEKNGHVVSWGTLSAWPLFFKYCTSLIASSHTHQTGANVPQSLFTTVQERFGEMCRSVQTKYAT